MEMIRKIVKVGAIEKIAKAAAMAVLVHASSPRTAWTQTALPPSFRPDGRATSDRSGLEPLPEGVPPASQYARDRAAACLASVILKAEVSADRPHDGPQSGRGSEPELNIARTRILEAAALRQLAAAYFLPSINPGMNYDSHSGNLQQSDGNILSLNRSCCLRRRRRQCGRIGHGHDPGGLSRREHRPGDFRLPGEQADGPAA